MATRLRRRRFLGLGAAGAGLIPVTRPSPAAASSTSEDTPNILLMLADDLGIGDLGVHGGRLQLPTIDELAANGLVCTAMYAAAATDTPSRAGLLTGRYGARYGLPATLTPEDSAGLPARATTIASLLREQGYATGYFGQWRLGSQAGQRPGDHGFDRFAGTLYGTDVSDLDWYEDDAVRTPSFDPALAARRITDRATEFVHGHRGDPVFAVLGQLAPHAPFRPEPDFFGRSEAGTYGDVVQQLDHYLGVLLQQVRRTTFRNGRRTLVIVTSDNGPRYEGRTQGRRGRKPEVFDGGVRVPFVAAWLDSSEAQRDHRPRSLLDVTPTLCRLAGVQPPDDLDGHAGFDESLDTERDADDRGVYLFYDRWLNAMRRGRWKLHVAFRDDQRAYMPQLFDLANDHRETYNLAESYPERTARMRADLEAVADDVAAEAAERNGANTRTEGT